MDLQTSFGVLSDVIDQYESRGRSVRDVEAAATDGVLGAELDVALSLCPGERGPTLAPETASLTDGGEVAVTFAPPELPDLPPEVASVVTAEPREVVMDGDRPVLRVTLAIEPTEDGDAGRAGDPPDEPREDGDDTASAAGDSGQGDSTDTAVGDDSAGPATTGLAAVRDESVPPYDDTPYLERLYETADTFAEMSRRIEMDVSSETVRRYMIEAGIHDPTPYDTAADEDTDGNTGPESDGTATDPADAVADPGGEEGCDSEPAESAGGEPGMTLPDEQLVTDGIGLPADLRVEEIADAVVGSATLYEVHRRLEIDRERTRRLLQELNLLDLVMRRLSTASEQEVTEDLVATRLRECAGGG